MSKLLLTSIRYRFKRSKTLACVATRTMLGGRHNAFAAGKQISRQNRLFLK